MDKRTTKKSFSHVHFVLKRSIGQPLMYIIISNYIWDPLLESKVGTSAVSQTLCSCSVRFGRVRQFFTRTWFGSGFGNIIIASSVIATAVGTGRAGWPAGPEQHGGLLHTASASMNFTLRNCSKRNYLWRKILLTFVFPSWIMFYFQF